MHRGVEFTVHDDKIASLQVFKQMLFTERYEK